MLVPFVGVALKRNIILGQAVIDYVACLLFFLTCLIKRFRMARPLRKVHVSTATVANYTVQITGVPQVCWYTWPLLPLGYLILLCKCSRAQLYLGFDFDVSL